MAKLGPVAHSAIHLRCVSSGPPESTLQGCCCKAVAADSEGLQVVLKLARHFLAAQRIEAVAPPKRQLGRWQALDRRRAADARLAAGSSPLQHKAGLAVLLMCLRRKPGRGAAIPFQPLACQPSEPVQRRPCSVAAISRLLSTEEAAPDHHTALASVPPSGQRAAARVQSTGAGAAAAAAGKAVSARRSAEEAATVGAAAAEEATAGALLGPRRAWVPAAGWTGAAALEHLHL